MPQDRTDDELAALYRDVFEDDRRGAAILEDLVKVCAWACRAWRH